jgi:hypothetical protein
MSCTMQVRGGEAATVQIADCRLQTALRKVHTYQEIEISDDAKGETSITY